MSVRLIITMCHRSRVNFGRVVNDRRRRPEMEKYNICCCSPRSLLLLEPRGAAAGLIRSILYDLSFRNHLSSLGRGRPLQWVSTVRRRRRSQDSHAPCKKVVRRKNDIACSWPCYSR